MLPVVLKLNISELILNKSVLCIINKAIDSMYCDAKFVKFCNIHYKNL